MYMPDVTAGYGAPFDFIAIFLEILHTMPDGTISYGRWRHSGIGKQGHWGIWTKGTLENKDIDIQGHRYIGA